MSFEGDLQSDLLNLLFLTHWLLMYSYYLVQVWKFSRAFLLL